MQATFEHGLALIAVRFDRDQQSAGEFCLGHQPVHPGRPVLSDERAGRVRVVLHRRLQLCNWPLIDAATNAYAQAFNSPAADIFPAQPGAGWFLGMVLEKMAALGGG